MRELSSKGAVRLQIIWCCLFVAWSLTLPASAGGLRGQLEALSDKHDFRISGLEHLKDTAARDAEGEAHAGDDAPENRIGSLAIGDGVARTDRPIYFISLVCRKKRDARVLWIDRTLVGNVPVEFTRQQWDRADNERCVRIQDLIRENHVGWGTFEYHVNVYDDPSLDADPIVTRVRKFSAVDPEPPLEEGPTPINFAADPDKTKPARY